MSNGDNDISMEEWLKHIRVVSTRLNRIIDFVCPGCTTWERAKRLGDDHPMVRKMRLSKCRIINEFVGCARVEISYWGRDYISITVVAEMCRGVCHSHWGVERMIHMKVSDVETRFSTAREHAGRVARIVGLISPLAPLFTSDKIQWMAGIAELEKLEKLAAEAPARRKVMA